MTCVGGRSNPKAWEKAKKDAIKKLGGRFSARAMQLAGKLYRERGGKYCGKKTAAQRKLTKWTGEDWRTASGKKACRRKDGRTVCDRYLPAKAWSKLTPAQRAATQAKKRRSTKQYVANTARAKAAGKRARAAMGFIALALLAL